MSNRRTVVMYSLLAAFVLLAPGPFVRAADDSKDLAKIPIADAPSYAKVALVIGVSQYKSVRRPR